MSNHPTREVQPPKAYAPPSIILLHPTKNARSPSRSPASDERGVMPCEEGQKLQDEFGKAVAERIRIEMRGRRSTEARDARVTEAKALKKRSSHFRKCFDCWRSPPKRR